MSRLTTRIGFIALILILLIALSSVLINAQSPDTAEATTEATTTTAEETAAPEVKTPVITEFRAAVFTSENNATPPNLADVEVSIEFTDFKLSTETPVAGENGEAQGMLKFTMDPVTEVPAPSDQAGSVSSPAEASPAQEEASPTINATPSPFPAGQSVLSTEKSFRFLDVSMGVHTFMVELVNFDGTSMSPRIFGSLTIEVMPPP